MRAILVAALACEARPLIDRLRLRPEASGASASPFRLYHGEQTELVVCGVGKVAAAAATAWAAGQAAAEEALAFVNFGCGGHGAREPGHVVLAHEIRDAASGRKWFPPLAFRPPCATARVITVERPETRFEDDALYEMEASGFIETASRFTTAELVHCLKFVSDNRSAPAAELDGRRIGELAQGALPALEALLAQLRELAEGTETAHRLPAAYDQYLERWRFSVTQGRQLRRLLERWQALVPGRAAPEDILRSSRSSREALAALGRHVEAKARSCRAEETDR